MGKCNACVVKCFPFNSPLRFYFFWSSKCLGNKIYRSSAAGRRVLHEISVVSEPYIGRLKSPWRICSVRKVIHAQAIVCTKTMLTFSTFYKLLNLLLFLRRLLFLVDTTVHFAFYCSVGFQNLDMSKWLLLVRVTSLRHRLWSAVDFRSSSSISLKIK